MQLEYLSDRPDAVKTIARWYYEEWGYMNPATNWEKEIANVKLYMNKADMPLIILATEGQEVLGAAQLKYQEMSIYPEKEHWLGGVYVGEGHRGKGIAAQIIRKIIARAAALGIQTLYLQTERLDGGLYAQLGWQPIEEVVYNGVRVLVMELEV